MTLPGTPIPCSKDALSPPKDSLVTPLNTSPRLAAGTVGSGPWPQVPSPGLPRAPAPRSPTPLAPPHTQHPPARRQRLAGGRPFKSPGSFAWPRPLSDTAGAGGPVPPAPGSLFLSSPEPGLRFSNWDSEPGLFLALARLQEGVSSRPLRWLLFFYIYHLIKLFIY